MVKEVVAPDDLMPRAIAYAEDIAGNCAPSSLAAIKRQLYGDSMRDVFEASDLAERLMHESMLRPDFVEGITAFVEKRAANFPPLSERSDRNDMRQYCSHPLSVNGQGADA
jgi:enoyl-CoA hydratase/carnithine racemase